MNRTTHIFIALAILLADFSALAQRPAATPPSTRFFRVGNAPGSVAIVDLNSDLNLDIIVANEGSSNVSILLGDGRGGFVQPEGSPFPAGKAPNDIAVGDFDEDGNLDLAFPNHETDHLTLLLGDGQGSFTTHPPVKVGSRPHPHGVATADFDGDGHLDLVVESFIEDRVEILLGDGQGGFRRDERRFPTGHMPYQKVRVADFNLDGRPDIVTTNMRGGNVTILFGDSAGGFVQAPPLRVSPSPFALAAGDVNADRNPDLAVIHYSGSINDPSRDSLTILLGDGTGGFTPQGGSPFRTGKAPVNVAIGDVNGDRVQDVAVTNLRSNDIMVYPGDRGGVSRTGGTPLRVGRRPDGIAIGDLNRDGKGDIVTANSADNNIAIILSR